jgi:hypothetical protein
VFGKRLQAAEKPHDGAASVLMEFIAGELRFERERRATLDQRGIAVVTSSGTLVTLLSGLAAFVALRSGQPVPSIKTFVALSLALTSLLAAAFLGISTNRSRGY